MLRRSARKRKPTAAVTQVAASAKRKVLRPGSNPEADIGQGTRSNPNITTVPQMTITTLGLHVLVNYRLQCYLTKFRHTVQKVLRQIIPVW